MISIRLTLWMNSRTQMSPLPGSKAGGRAPLMIATASFGTLSTRMERWGGMGEEPSSQLLLLAWYQDLRTILRGVARLMRVCCKAR